MRLLLLCLPLAVPQEPSSWESVGEIDCLAEGARCFGCHTLNYCNGHGKCTSGMCVCNDGWYGRDCGLQACTNCFGNHRHCFNGSCTCEQGFTQVRLQQDLGAGLWPRHQVSR